MGRKQRISDPHPADIATAEQQVGRPEKRGYETGLRPDVQVARFAHFLQPSPIHDPDPVGHRERLLLVVCHEDRRNADRTLNPANRAPELFPDLRIERTEGLIEEQHARFVREGARDGDTLLLAARKLRRQAPIHALERDEPQQLGAPPPPLAHGHAPRSQREFDVVGDRHVPEKRIVLEDEADLPLLCADARHVSAVQHDAAVVDRRESGNGAQERALPASGRAEEHEELAFGNLDRHVADGGGAVVML